MTINYVVFCISLILQLQYQWIFWVNWKHSETKAHLLLSLAEKVEEVTSGESEWAAQGKNVVLFPCLPPALYSAIKESTAQAG